MRVRIAENRVKAHSRTIDTLKSEINTIISQNLCWERPTQREQYIKIAYEHWGESERTHLASLVALKRMATEHPHDHEFTPVSVDPVPRFGVKRFVALVQFELDAVTSESTPEQVIEDFQRVFSENEPADHSFGPRDTKYPIIILPEEQRDLPLTVGLASNSNPKFENPPQSLHKTSNITSRQSNRSGKKSDLLKIPTRGVSLPGSPNAVAANNTKELHSGSANFRSGSRSGIGGSPSSVNSQTAGKSSHGVRSQARSVHKQSNSAAKVEPISEIHKLQPPCLARLSQTPPLVGGSAQKQADTKRKLTKLTIESSLAYKKRFLPDSRSN